MVGRDNQPWEGQGATIVWPLLRTRKNMGKLKTTATSLLVLASSFAVLLAVSTPVMRLYATVCSVRLSPATVLK